MEHRVRVAFRNRPKARMGRGLVRPALHWRARLPDVPVEEAQQSLGELDPVGLHLEAESFRRLIQRLDRPPRDFPPPFHLVAVLYRRNLRSTKLAVGKASDSTRRTRR